MTPNKSDSGELQSIEQILNSLILDVGSQVTRDYEWKHGIYEGMSISNVRSRDKAIEALTTHIQTIGEEIIACDYCDNTGCVTVRESGDKYADSEKEPCDECQEARQRLAHYLRKDKE